MPVSLPQTNEDLSQKKWKKPNWSCTASQSIVTSPSGRCVWSNQVCFPRMRELAQGGKERGSKMPAVTNLIAAFHCMAFSGCASLLPAKSWLTASILSSRDAWDSLTLSSDEKAVDKAWTIWTLNWKLLKNCKTFREKKKRATYHREACLGNWIFYFKST